MRVEKRERAIEHTNRIWPILTLFLAFIVVLLAGCASSEDSSTPTTFPVNANTPIGTIFTMEPLSTIPMSPDAPVTESAEETSIAITPSVDLPFFPDEVVITLHQEGGFAGLDDEWILYQDGRIEMNGEVTGQLSAQELVLLLDTLDQSGFFELDHPEPGTFCCDFFTFTIAAALGDKSNSISVSDGDPDLPANINEIISVLLQSLSP